MNAEDEKDGRGSNGGGGKSDGVRCDMPYRGVISQKINLRSERMVSARRVVQGSPSYII